MTEGLACMYHQKTIDFFSNDLSRNLSRKIPDSCETSGPDAYSKGMIFSRISACSSSGSGSLRGDPNNSLVVVCSRSS